MEKIHEKDTKVTPTEVIVIEEDNEMEQQFREMSKEELLHRLHFEEADPKNIELIKKILKTKA